MYAFYSTYNIQPNTEQIPIESIFVNFIGKRHCKTNNLHILKNKFRFILYILVDRRLKYIDIFFRQLDFHVRGENVLKVNFREIRNALRTTLLLESRRPSHATRLFANGEKQNVINQLAARTVYVYICIYIYIYILICIIIPRCNDV